MRRLIFCMLLFLCTAAARVGALKVEVVATASPTAASDSNVVRATTVSSSDHIVMRFTIANRELVKGSTAGTSAAPLFDLSALDDKGTPVTVNHSVTGVSVEYTRVTVTVLVEIPIESAERRRLVAEFVDATISESSGRMTELLTAQRDAAIAAIERLFVQNRLGDYRLRVILRDPRVDPAEGEVRIHVADLGTFIDKLRQRPQESKQK